MTRTTDLPTADLIIEDGVVQRVRLEGRLDTAGVDAVKSRFIAATVVSGKHAIVELGDVSYIAAVGIRMLVSAAKRMAAAGRILVLLEPQPAVNAYLETAGIYRLIPVAYSESEAALLVAE